MNCVDWRLYQNGNSYDVDRSRLYVNGEGSVPAWPVTTYSFNAQSSAGQLDFSMSQSDLDSKKCIKFSAATQISWECFFEMAFIVKGIT